MVITIAAFTAMCLPFNTQQDARVGKGIKPKSRFWTGSGCVRGQHGVIMHGYGIAPARVGSGQKSRCKRCTPLEMPLHAQDLGEFWHALQTGRRANARNVSF